MKSAVSVRAQWAFFRELEELVEAGGIAMPRQVIREVSEMMHPDAPGVWARGMEPKLIHPIEVDYDCVGEVMARAGKLVEDSATTDVADPYVVALALQLMRAGGAQITVVSEDIVDRLPLKMSILTACGLFGITHCTTSDLLAELGYL